MQAKPPAYGARVIFLALLGLLIGIAGRLPEWNWWHLSGSYIALEMADLLTGSTPAGRVTPHLLVRNAPEAMELYRSPMPGGMGWHLHVRIADSVVVLPDEMGAGRPEGWPVARRDQRRPDALCPRRGRRRRWRSA
jgi:hypothetical protein